MAGGANPLVDLVPSPDGAVVLRVQWALVVPGQHGRVDVDKNDFYDAPVNREDVNDIVEEASNVLEIDTINHNKH